MAGSDLSDVRLRGLKPQAKHYDVVDGRGLLIRVHPSGRKTWMLRAIDGRTGDRVRRELGEYPALSLASARAKAAQWRELIRQGKDPTQKVGELTVKAAMEAWLKDAGLRSEEQVRRRFELHVLPTLGKRLIADLGLKDIARLLRTLRHEKGLTSEANRVRASLSALFGWAQAQGEVVVNPVLATERAKEASALREQAGTTRVLSMDELALIWRVAEADRSLLLSVLLRMLILVPLRREEWTAARWDELSTDGKNWTLRIPADRMKGKRPHAVPIPAAAKALLERLPHIGPYIFTATGTTPFAGWRSAAVRLKGATKTIPPWVVHDLRRGVATQMGEGGVRENTIRRILAHSPRSMMGITATYERSERLDEMREALERWWRLLEVRLNPVEGNVVRLESRGG